MQNEDEEEDMDALFKSLYETKAIKKYNESVSINLQN
jgi:hypothetical protein